MKSRNLFAFLAAWLVASPAAQAQSTPPAADATPTVLDPFTVVSSSDVGFVAANSLSGGRTASALADTPIAYSVQTREFLDALNITSLDEAFEWSPNSHLFSNDQQAGIALGVDPLANSTVRGVQTGAPLRNFFNVSYTFDAYNTDRFDFMRGPDSVLFGAGTISGAPNTGTKFALPGQSIDEVRLQFDSHGSARFTADVNQPLGDKIAFRLNVVRDDGKTWRNGEIKDKSGVSPSLTINLTPTTQLRVEGEYATDKLRQMISPLRDSLSGWDGTTFGLQSFAVSSADQNTYNIHGVSRIGTSTSSQTYIYTPDHSAIVNYAGTVQTVGYNTNMRTLDGLLPTAGTLSINGAPILDLPDNLPASSLADLYSVATQNSNFRVPKRSFTNLGTAPVGTDRDKDISVGLNQRVGDSLFLELAGDANTRNNYGNASYWYSDTVTGFGNTYIDVNRTAPTGAANPEYLEPYQQAGLDRRFQNSVYAGGHLAASYSKEWAWADLSLNAIGGIDRDSQWTVREIGVLPINADPREWGLNNANSFPVYYRQYFDRAPASPPPMETAMTVTNPLTGLTSQMTPQWVLSTSRTEGGVTESWTNTNYGQISAQLSFLKKHLILLGAFRQDQEHSVQKLGLRAESYPVGWNPTNDHYLWRPDAPANWAALAGSRPLDANGVPLAANLAQAYQNDFNPPNVSTKANTKSLGGIVRLWYGFSMIGNYGTTYNPPAIGNETIYFTTPAASTSDSTEVGLRYNLPGGRISASITHFTSQTVNFTGGQPSGYSNINTIINTASLTNPNSGTNSRGLGDVPFTWYDLENLASSGWEGEITANLTRQWRLMFNVGTSNATASNLYPMTRGWLAANSPTLIQILNDAGVVVTNNVATVPTTTPVTAGATTSANAWNSLQASAANWVTGTQLLSHMIKYTANIFTDYTFQTGAIRGLRLGVGYRYRGPEVIGFDGANTIPNPANPATAIADPSHNAYTAVWDHSYGLATVTAAYPFKFGKQRIDLNVTVNNALNYRDPIYNAVGLRPYNGYLPSPARTEVPLDYTYIPPINFTVSLNYRF